MLVDALKTRWVWAGLGAALIIYQQLRATLGRRWLTQALRKAIKIKIADRGRTIEIVGKQMTATEESTKLAIRSLSFMELSQAIKRLEYTCLQVLHAYQESALAAHEETNCATWFMVEAEQEARQRDALLQNMTADEVASLSPLYGIPCSVKESVAVKGVDCTNGLAQNIGKPMTEDCVYVSALRAAGAVPFVTTNVPQTCLSYASSNPIYGFTSHPNSKTLCPGGSSSGEGSLIAMKGSQFGTGTDLGGSIRLPAHLTGVYGFRPTMGRVSKKGTVPSTPGRQVIGSSIGPLAQSLDAIETVMQVLCDFDYLPVDCYVVPIKWSPVQPRPLRIGFYATDGFFQPVPAIQRAVREAAELLQQMGHTLIEFKVPHIRKLVPLATGLIRCDNSAYVNQLLRNDIIEPTHYLQSSYNMMGVVGRWFMCRLMSNEMKDLLSRYPQTSNDLREVYAATEQFRQLFEQSWVDENIDVMLTPACGTIALPTALVQKATGAYSYTLLYNVLDYCAGVVPWTNVTEDDVQECAKASYPTESQYHRIVYAANSKPECVGLPVGLQIVAPPYREELCLMAMAQLDLAKTKR